jgi:hypothetical protein
VWEVNRVLAAHGLESIWGRKAWKKWQKSWWNFTWNCGKTGSEKIIKIFHKGKNKKTFKYKNIIKKGI